MIVYLTSGMQPWPPLTRGLAAKLTGGEINSKQLEFLGALGISLPPSRLTASHLPRQREACVGANLVR